MAVPDWPPTRIMKELFDKNYKAQSGNNVKLDVDFIPWPDYYTRLNASLTSGEKKYNMAVSDSQWLGAFIEGGYYRKINEFIDADPELQKVFKDLHPDVAAGLLDLSLQVGRTTTASRRCRTCWSTTTARTSSATPSEQKNFQAKYNQKLPCTPEEMDDDRLGQVRRSSASSSGARRARCSPASRRTTISTASPTRPARATTSRSMQINGFIWQHGGDIWDETKAPNGHAEGVVNSPEAVKALDHYLRLTQVHAAGRQDRRHGHLQDRRAVPRRQGRR